MLISEGTILHGAGHDARPDEVNNGFEKTRTTPKGNEYDPSTIPGILRVATTRR